MRTTASFAALLLATTGCADAGFCSLVLDGVDEGGTFGWCNVLILAAYEDEPEHIRIVADLLDTCPDDGLCAFFAELPTPEGALPAQASCDGAAGVNLLHPSFDDPATEEQSQDGGAGEFRDGSSCTITTTAFDRGLLTGQPSWSGTIEAVLQLNESTELVEITVEGAVPARNEGFAVDSDPASKR